MADLSERFRTIGMEPSPSGNSFALMRGPDTGLVACGRSVVFVAPELDVPFIDTDCDAAAVCEWLIALAGEA